MYNLPYFKEKDEQVILDFIHQHPFAFITGCDENSKPVATQIPVFIEKKGERLYMTGHMMKNTDHHKAFEKNPNALCVFTGAHSYVSASWYVNQQQASTWNYMSVHAKGLLRFLDEQGLVEVLKKTSLHFENGNTASPTTYDNLPEEYTSKLLKAIVAFEVEVESIENVFKLSQNRDQKSFQNIVEQLENLDAYGNAVADEMKKREKDLFNQ
ncbi:MAG: FMN-binding negative transcriptional regulator [Chitinophagaceae bacterium]|nr:MAG: FMN-binding negative transcriptional regulator [Chitinophagaceae bacterium]